MNKKTLLFTILALVVVIAGGTLLYNQLVVNVEAPDTLQTSPKTPESPAETPPAETSSSAETASTTEEVVNPAALDFTFVDNSGEQVQLFDFIGKPIVVNFWASWCPPCKMEMPYFQDAYEIYGDDVVFLMISMTGGREDEKEARSYIEKSGYTFPIYHDADQNAAMTYGVYSLPTSVFINKKGEIVAFQEGALTEAMLAKGLSLILAD